MNIGTFEIIGEGLKKKNSLESQICRKEESY